MPEIYTQYDAIIFVQVEPATSGLFYLDVAGSNPALVKLNDCVCCA